MDDPSFAQEWGPLIAAGFAAAAAGASWVSALISQRTWRDSRRPHLTAQLLQPTDGPVQLHVRNFGSGSASKASYYAVKAHQYATGILTPDAFLAPGQGVAIVMNFDPRDMDSLQYVLMCLDRETDVHVWTREEKARVYKRRPWTKVHEIGWFFKKAYGRRVPDNAEQVASQRFPGQAPRG